MADINVTLTISSGITSTVTLAGSVDANIALGTVSSAGIVQNATHTGDATGATALTLATVNSTVGSFVNPTFTVNAKGLITYAENGVGPASEYKGIAHTTDNPGTPASECYYMCDGPGVYTNFGNITITGNFSFLAWDGAVWHETDQTISTYTIGQVTRGLIIPYVVTNGLYTEKWLHVLPNTVVQVQNNVSTYNGGGNGNPPLVVNLIAGKFLIRSKLSAVDDGYLGVWCDYTGNLYGAVGVGGSSVRPAMPTGGYVLIGESGVNGWSNTWWNLRPYLESSHVLSYEAADWFVRNGESIDIINAADFGCVSIDSYVTGYNYVKRALTTTTPVLTDKNYYIARCEIGVNTFTNFTNGGTPYAVTVTEATIIALKYDTATEWSHTVLPFFDLITSYCLSKVCNYKHLLFSSGTYLFSLLPYYALSITGSDREDVSIMNMEAVPIDYPAFWSVYKGLTMYNYYFSDYTRPVALEIHDCTIIAESEILDSGSTYLINLNSNNLSIYYSHKFINVNFNYSSLYTCIWGYYIEHIDIIGCRFEGTSISHPIRINNCSNGGEVAYNYVNGGVTGIFFGSQRVHPIENINVHNNEVCNQSEEGISFDGFGNNAVLCPVICNGLITAASNDVNGRLVITADHKYNPGSGEADYPISSRADWTSFYFAFQDGSGLEGQLYKIYAFDDGTDSITLDCIIPNADVTVGGWCGVEAGFFNCQIKDNIVYNTGTSGITCYQNVFNMQVTGNTLYNCKYGLVLSGGRMLSVYRTLAYNCVFRDNNVYGTLDLVLYAPSLYNDLANPIRMYGNSWINNNIYGGLVTLDRQFNLVFENNKLFNCTVSFTNCQDTLPTATANHIGMKFLLFTNDGNGHPTDITEYVCKLTGGVYSWSEL